MPRWRGLLLLMCAAGFASAPAPARAQALVAVTVRGVIIQGSGHWLMEEAPHQVIPPLAALVNDEPLQKNAAYGQPDRD